MDAKQLILLGPPGSGVEAQAIALSQRWQVPFVSVDELLQGAIAPDAKSLKTLLRRRFEQPDTMLKGWVLAGFASTVAQAELFDEVLAGFGESAAKAAYIQASTGILINRLATQGKGGESVSALRDRLTQYKEAINPVLEYYRAQSRLTIVNGSRSEAEVANDLVKIEEKETGAARFVQSEAELDELISQESLLVVDCVASWCGPCKQVSPLIDRLAEEYGDRARVMKLDFDNNRQVSKRFGLKGMPSVMFFRQGELQETLTGMKPYSVYNDVLTKLLPN